MLFHEEHKEEQKMEQSTYTAGLMRKFKSMFGK